MLENRIFIALLITVSLNGCQYLPGIGDALPDNRTDYKKSKKLPDLEVPPDLTTDTLQDPLAVPDEELATTLSEFQRRKLMRQSNQALATRSGVSPSGELFLSTNGEPTQIWPKLNDFWEKEGYGIYLDDADLGVMETEWKEHSTDNVVSQRDKFRIFAEQNEEAGTLLVIEHTVQEKITYVDGKTSWLERDSNLQQLRQTADALNVFFHGNAAPSSNIMTANTANTTPDILGRAEILNAGENKEYLTIPEEFSSSWKQAENLIRQSGILIAEKDQAKGLYHVIYYDTTVEEEEGFFSKLAFWEEEKTKETPYRISLTGVGNKTEVIILNEDGSWADDERAHNILELLQSQYDQSK